MMAFTNRGSSNNHGQHDIETKSNSTTFEAIARKHGTNKVTSHRYQSMYEKYLGPLQGKPIKFLEIGLGCNMVRTLAFSTVIRLLISLRTMVLGLLTTHG